ncbi:MAG TPA: SEC-C metal-binding domain-containing protein [Nannocystis sp.]|jgi:uncharacterized protein YecA (UPF0149 family)
MATDERHDHEHDHGHAHEHVHGPGCAHDHEHAGPRPYVREQPKVGRNDPCVCGSGKKFKKCCGA